MLEGFAQDLGDPPKGDLLRLVDGVAVDEPLQGYLEPDVLVQGRKIGDEEDCQRTPQ